MKFLVFLLFPAILFAETYVDTNYFTTKTSVTTTNMVIQKKKVVPVKRIEWVKVQKLIEVTNTTQLTNTTELTNLVTIVTTNPHHNNLITIGGTVCGRALLGYDYIWNLGPVDLSLGGFGMYNIYNAVNYLQHTYDVGGRIGIGF